MKIQMDRYLTGKRYIDLGSKKLLIHLLFLAISFLKNLFFYVYTP